MSTNAGTTLERLRPGGPEYDTYAVNGPDGTRVGVVRLLTVTERVPPHELALDMARGRVPEAVRKTRKWSANLWAGPRAGPLLGDRYDTRDQAVAAVARAALR